MSRQPESDMDRAARTVKKVFHKVKQTTSSRHEFLHFQSLNRARKIQIQLDGFEHINRAIFSYSRDGDFDPVPFSVREKFSQTILFRAEVQCGRGFVVHDLTLPAQERKLMIVTLPNDPSRNQAAAVERTVAKLQVASDETLHKIALILSPNSDQYHIHNVFKTTSGIHLRVQNPWWHIVTKLCFEYYTNCHKVVKDGQTMGKLTSETVGSEKIITIEFRQSADEQTRAVILGTALYFTMTGIPELLRLLNSTLPESPTRTIDV